MRKFLATLLMLLPEAALAQTEIDLPALIECRADAKAWGGLAFSLMGDPGAVEALGWTQVLTENPFLQEYALEQTLSVFGHETKNIALTSSGPMAVLDDVEAEELAATLGVSPVTASPGQFLGEKVILDETEESDGMTFRTKVALNVSTVESHPGKVLAGCSYVIEAVGG